MVQEGFVNHLYLHGGAVEELVRITGRFISNPASNSLGVSTVISSGLSNYLTLLFSIHSISLSHRR